MKYFLFISMIITLTGDYGNYVHDFASQRFLRGPRIIGGGNAWWPLSVEKGQQAQHSNERN